MSPKDSRDLVPELQRFSVGADPDHPGFSEMRPDDEGTWVRFEDSAKRLKEAERQREELKREFDEATQELAVELIDARREADQAEAALADRDRQVRAEVGRLRDEVEGTAAMVGLDRIEAILDQPSSNPPQQDREAAEFLKLKERLLGDDAARAFFRAVNGIVPEPNADEIGDVRHGLAAAWNAATGHEDTALTQPEADPEVPRCGATVAEVRAEADRWAKHHRKEESAAEDRIAEQGGGDYSIEREHRAVAEAFEEIVQFIDSGPHEQARSELKIGLRRLKEEHGGRRR
jgi:hypothetical protein